MSAWSYINPVDVTFGAGALASLPKLLKNRSYCLITYNDHPAFDQLARQIEQMVGAPAVSIREVEPNPSFNGLRKNCATFAQSKSEPQVIIALGGGSVIDTAKVVAGAGGDFALVQNFLEGKAGIETLHKLPIIAIPTTAGTGSEVTCWATAWDTDAKKKYSLAHARFYPEAAIVDPSLTLGVPPGLTMSTALDSLSHALESIWNVNANPVSTNHAVFAAREVMEVLPLLMKDLGNFNLRSRIMRAALFAGLAFSNTKTALAHSLSYYLTLHHGTVHGIACSFCLPAVMRSVIGQNADCDAGLRRIFGDDLDQGVSKLENFLAELGVSTRATDYGVSEVNWRAAIADALEGERGRNFIGRSDAVMAYAA
jgi:alcohol dehydrogenase